jgi:DNA polymerase IIIc chi subunit
MSVDSELIKNKNKNKLQKLDLYVLKPESSENRVSNWLFKLIDKVYFKDHSIYAGFSDNNILNTIDNDLWEKTNKFIPHLVIENGDIKPDYIINCPILLNRLCFDINLLDKNKDKNKDKYLLQIKSKMQTRKNGCVVICVIDLSDYKYSDFADLINNLKAEFFSISEAMDSQRCVCVFYGLNNNSENNNSDDFKAKLESFKVDLNNNQDVSDLALYFDL